MAAQPVYLVCDTCGYCCCLCGPVARAMADDPPPCPTCHQFTRASDDAPISRAS